jgi:hypothetical protein
MVPGEVAMSPYLPRGETLLGPAQEPPTGPLPLADRDAPGEVAFQRPYTLSRERDDQVEAGGQPEVRVAAFAVDFVQEHFGERAQLRSIEPQRLLLEDGREVPHVDRTVTEASSIEVDDAHTILLQQELVGFEVAVNELERS